MRSFAIALGVALSLGLAACIGPSDRRAGFALTGEVVDDFPTDWSFSDAEREIAVEVSSPYFIPHSVTVWCATRAGILHLGARDPETKSWPGWVDDDPNVRLRIAGKLYDVRLEPVEDAAQIAAIRRAYAAKYELPQMASGEGPPIRYWTVVPRES